MTSSCLAVCAGQSQSLLCRILSLERLWKTLSITRTMPACWCLCSQGRCLVVLNFFSIFSSCWVHQIKWDCEDLSCRIIHYIVYSFASVRVPTHVRPQSPYAVTLHFYRVRQTDCITAESLRFILQLWIHCLKTAFMCSNCVKKCVIVKCHCSKLWLGMSFISLSLLSSNHLIIC